jgi:PAS domain S-box-containing protein
MKLSTRLTLAMVGLVLLTTTAVGLSFAWNLEARALPRALDRIDMHAHLLAFDMEATVRAARFDVLTQGRAVEGLVLARTAGVETRIDGTSEDQWRQRLASRFVAELKANPAYAEFRVIGLANNGREIVRVDRAGPEGAIHVATNDELQYRGDRDYLKTATSLSAGEAYTSPIDLSQPDGTLSSPPIPTLRVAAPIPAPDGKPFGVMAVKVDMREEFAAIRKAANRDERIYVVNELGDFLVHPDQGKEFGWQLGQPIRVQDTIPEFAGLLGQGNTEPRIMRDRQGNRFGIGWASVRLAGGPLVTVIDEVPYASILIPITGLPSVLGAVIALLGAIPLAVLLARSLSRPLVQMTKAVEDFTRGELTVIPTSAKGEIGVLARAFARMSTEVSEKAASLQRETDERRAADEKFRLAVDASPSGLVMSRSDGTIVLINAQAERIFGYERGELLGQSIDRLVPEAFRRHHAELREGFVAKPKTRSMAERRDLFGVRKDGSEFPSEIGLNPINTKNGLLILSAVVDISERKRAEAEIREYAERERLFIAAVESSNDAIVTETLDGVITGWNQAAERLFGFSANESIGQRIDIIVPEELRSEVRTILDGIKEGVKIDHHETERINKDGRRILVSLSISPVKSANGTIIGAAKVVRDVTQRKKMQEDLLESEQMARGIIDTSLDAFLQLDESGVIVDWSPKAENLFGWSRAEAIGERVRDLIVLPENREVHSERLAQFLQDADGRTQGRRYEAVSLRRDGKVIYTEISLTALRRREGYVINGFIRDLTESKAAQERIRQSEKLEAVGQLTGGVAHDFNNMLTVITGTIDLLAEAVADKPQLAAIAKLISEAADRGAELTSHLLAFARKQPLQPREIDVNALVVESTKLLRRAIGENIEIELKSDQSAWPALVDATQLTSALLNLAVNARDAMPDGGKITLETRNIVVDDSNVDANREIQPGRYVMIAVSDSGSGIPAAIRDRIFEPFFSTKAVGKGTGLGLSMVYGFVKQSGGHIKVYSEEGQGTTFNIYLPQAQSRADHAADPTTDTSPESGTETILVVEDDPSVRTSVTTQLASLGYRTIAAANASEALALMDGNASFDLLFTDVIMPGPVNGRRLAEEAAKRRPELRVLFTSGYTEDAIVHHGRLDPGVLLLTKPYRKADLARMIRVALDRRDGRPAAAVGA